MYKVKPKQHIWFDGQDYHGGDTLPDNFETQFANFDSVVIQIEGSEAIEGDYEVVEDKTTPSAKKGRK